MRHTSGRIRRLTAALAGAFALTALAAAPGGAEAADVKVSKSSQNGNPSYLLFYDAFAGEQNNLEVKDVGDKVVFTDSAFISTPPGANCQPGNPDGTPNGKAVTCSDVGLEQVFINVKDGPNQVNLDGSSYPLNNVGGGAQLDRFVGGGGRDVFEAGAGDDELFGGGGNDQLEGGEENDLLVGGTGSDAMIGNAGSDTADYFSRTQSLTVVLDDLANDGQAGEQDNVKADVENVRGGSNLDTLTGPAGDVSNNLSGNGGPDVLKGGGGQDTLSGGTGVDNLNGDGGGDTISGDAADDTLRGGDGDDTLNGSQNNDILLGGQGADKLIGQSGTDTVNYSNISQRVFVDPDGVAEDDGALGEKDTVAVDVENITGGPASDTLSGNAAANVIGGGAGNDTIRGGVERTGCSETTTTTRCTLSTGRPTPWSTAARTPTASRPTRRTARRDARRTCGRRRPSPSPGARSPPSRGPRAPRAHRSARSARWLASARHGCVSPAAGWRRCGCPARRRRRRAAAGPCGCGAGGARSEAGASRSPPGAAGGSASRSAGAPAGQSAAGASVSGRWRPRATPSRLRAPSSGRCASCLPAASHDQRRGEGPRALPSARSGHRRGAGIDGRAPLPAVLGNRLRRRGRRPAGGGDRRATELAGRSEAVLGTLGHGAGDDLVELARQVGRDVGHRGRRLGGVRQDLRHVASPRIRDLS